MKTSDRLLSSDSVQAWRDLPAERRARIASRMSRTLERATLQFARTLTSSSAASNVTDNIGTVPVYYIYPVIAGGYSE